MTIDQKLYDAMEDWDNWDMSTEERREQLEESVLKFNEENGTDFDPILSYLSYELQRRMQDM